MDFLGISEKPLVIVGHRGWPSRFPENTLAGLIAAGSLADGVEVDVRRSGDGKLVLSHDPVLGGRSVATSTWEILVSVELSGGHRPALLDEAIGLLPGVPVVMEIKNLPGEPGFEPDHRLALECAERARPGDIVTSFNWASMDAVRRGYPGVATGLVVGLLGDLGEALGRCLDAGHNAVFPDRRLVQPGPAMEKALEEGVPLIAWVVNDPKGFDDVASIGARGVITDQPDVMTAARERVA